MPLHHGERPSQLASSKQGHVFIAQMKEKEIKVFNLFNHYIGSIVLPTLKDIHEIHVMDLGAQKHRLVILHKEKSFHNDILHISMVTPTDVWYWLQQKKGKCSYYVLFYVPYTMQVNQSNWCLINTFKCHFSLINLDQC